jgi:hypothetical protein
LFEESNKMKGLEIEELTQAISVFKQREAENMEAGHFRETQEVVESPPLPSGFNPHKAVRELEEKSAFIDSL